MIYKKHNIHDQVGFISYIKSWFYLYFNHVIYHIKLIKKKKTLYIEIFIYTDAEKKTDKIL